MLFKEKTVLIKLYVRSFRVCQDRTLRGAKFKLTVKAFD